MVSSLNSLVHLHGKDLPLSAIRIILLSEKVSGGVVCTTSQPRRAGSRAMLVGWADLPLHVQGHRSTHTLQKMAYALLLARRRPLMVAFDARCRASVPNLLRFMENARRHEGLASPSFCEGILQPPARIPMCGTKPEKVSNICSRNRQPD
jgi:hypothetical protein